MKLRTRSKNRQGGAIAIIVGVSMVIIIGLLALVIDLGRLYTAKAELQNAADAAALAAARQLNGTALGVNDPLGGNGAVQFAIAMAAQNKYDFASKNVDITIADISIGSCPDNGCSMTPASSVLTDADAAGKYFIKVHTGMRTFDTWFAPIWNFFMTSTFGEAVAGRSHVPITPMAVCAVDVRQCPCLPGESNCGQGGGLCGYEAGKSYRVTDINPLGPGTPLWLDPVATSATSCDGSTHEARPFVCRGEAAVATTPGEFVYTNTGLSAGPLYAAMDSRFGDYAPAGKCDPATAPPAPNIQEFAYQLFDDVGPLVSGQNPYKNQALIPDWLTPAPNPNPPSGVYSQVSNCTRLGTNDQYGGAIFDCPWTPNGVYWAASRPPASGVPGVATNANYPATGTPFSQTSGSYFLSGGSNAATGRRFSSFVIVQCEAAGGECRPAKIRMVGQFLLQTRVAVANSVNAEFVRPVSQDELRGKVMLYR